MNTNNLNQRIGMYSSIVNVCSVVAFAVCMLINNSYMSYLVCMFIAFSFVPMICAFVYFSKEKTKVAGYTAMLWAAVYAVFILIVYFAQVTAVALNDLNEQAKQLIDYSSFGLFFSYDLLGYGLMALSTFFAGLTILEETKIAKWLRRLLMIHGIFFIACLIMPILGVFKPGMVGMDWIGVMVLEVWCIYFVPIGILSYLYFKEKISIR